MTEEQQKSLRSYGGYGGMGQAEMHENLLKINFFKQCREPLWRDGCQGLKEGK